VRGARHDGGPAITRKGGLETKRKAAIKKCVPARAGEKGAGEGRKRRYRCKGITAGGGWIGKPSDWSKLPRQKGGGDRQTPIQKTVNNVRIYVAGDREEKRPREKKDIKRKKKT